MTSYYRDNNHQPSYFGFGGFFLLLIILFSATSQAVPLYTVTSLGTLGGTFSEGNGINDQGQITGDSTTGNGQYDAFLYQNGTMTDLGTLRGGVFASSEGNGINDQGQITGDSFTRSDGQDHAFLYQNGTMTDLGTLGGGQSLGNGINDQGQITGSSTDSSGQGHAFLYQNGTMFNLNNLVTNLASAGFSSLDEGYGINDRGQITGISTTSGVIEEQHAFLYQNGTVTDLGTLGGRFSEGRGINDQGQITGDSLTNNSQTHAFLYQNGIMIDLGTLGGGESEGFGINNQGQITGDSLTNNGQTTAFLYQNGTMFNLNNLVTNLASAGFSSLDGGYGINDRGQITGTGESLSGQEQVAFLATPENPVRSVSEPSTLVLLSGGLILLGRKCRNQAIL